MTQPPNQPPQPPGQFPPPPPPEGEGGAGVPPNPYGTPPYGPSEPSKSRTGLIIALVVGAVVVLAAVLVVGLVVLVGDDDDAASDDPVASASADTETSAGETESDAPAADGDVAGEGYHFALPKGWHDISQSSEVSSQPTLDSGAADAKSIVQSSANVLVEMVPVGGTSVADVRDQLRTTYETEFGATVEDLPDREIGGENTHALTMTRPSTSNPKVQVEQVSYVLVRDDTAYVITSSRAVDFPKTEASVEGILDSWVWE